MLETLTPDDLTTYIIMFWFVAMPVGLVVSLWLHWRMHKRIWILEEMHKLPHAILAETPEFTSISEQQSRLLKVLQSHTAAIAKLEETVNRDNWGMPKVYDISEDQKEWNDVVAKTLKKVGLCKPPKSLKDKVLAASKRNGKRGKTS